jgi:hypothetical protein
MAAYFDLTDLFAFRELGEAYRANVMWIHLPLASLVLAYCRQQFVSYVIYNAHFAIKPSYLVYDKECEESFKKHYVIFPLYKKEECQQTRRATLLVHGWRS